MLFNKYGFYIYTNESDNCLKYAYLGESFTHLTSSYWHMTIANIIEITCVSNQYQLQYLSRKRSKLNLGLYF